MKTKVCSFLELHMFSNVISIDLQGHFFSWIIIASGRSKRHIDMTSKLLKGILRREGAKNISLEGIPESGWILIDIGDGGVINLLSEEIRETYRLEEIYLNS